MKEILRLLRTEKQAKKIFKKYKNLDILETYNKINKKWEWDIYLRIKGIPLSQNKKLFRSVKGTIKHIPYFLPF